MHSAHSSRREGISSLGRTTRFVVETALEAEPLSFFLWGASGGINVENGHFVKEIIRHHLFVEVQDFRCSNAIRNIMVHALFMMLAKLLTI